MQFKKGQIAKILGCTQAVEDKWFDAINAACAQYQINTKLRLAAFIAQVGHESGRLSAATENLNYSAQGLMKTWPGRFDAAKAADCARNPQKIANVVYANRMGNGSEASGDGWNYRGRGLIQCTGKAVYQAFSQSAGINAVANPDMVAQVQYAALSAAWFFAGYKGLNAYADRSDFKTTTLRINGGLIGQDDREKLYKIALVVLSDETPTDDAVKKAEPTPDTTAPVSEQTTPAAQNSSIVEPKAVSGDTSKYPWNFVTESRSGHYSEVDDTPGNERLNMTHRTGSYWEFNSAGTFTLKSTMDAYWMAKNDSYGYVGGNYTQQVSGQAYRQSSGDMIFKTGGNYFVNASKVQMNTGMMSVSGEINAPQISSSMFGGMSGGFSYGDMLAKESLVAYDLKKGGGPMLGGSLGFTGGSSSNPAAAGSADSQMTNKLSKQSPTGKAWVTNGVDPKAAVATPGSTSATGGLNDMTSGASAAGTTQSSTLSGTSDNSGASSSDPDIPPETGSGFRVSDLAAVGIGAMGVAAAVSSIIQSNDTDDHVSQAMAQAVSDINQQSYADTNQTPVFLKHVTFDKPVLLSQSLPGDIPDPSLYQNNLHVVVDPVSGLGQLVMSSGSSWNAVNDPSQSKAYTDSQVEQATIDYNNKLLAESAARNDAISAAILQEATDRGAAVVAEANARQAADSSLSDLITTLTASSNDNAAAIQTETQARTDAITAEATARQNLAAQVADNVASLQTELDTQANASSATATKVDTLTSRISNGNASSFAPYQTWQFLTVAGGWGATGATFSITNKVGVLTSTSTDPILTSPALSVVGSTYNKIRMRVKRTAGSGWQGQLFYSTAGHGFSGSYVATITPDPGLGDWYVLEWDMVTISDWMSNTITSIRFDLGTTATDVFQIDWISIGSRIPGVDGSSFATVQTQSSTTATDVGNIKAQWAIKTTVNGYVSGIALVNDLINGNPTSSFAVQANVFKLVSPDGSKVSTPFTVDSNGNAYFSGTGTFGGTVTGNVTGTVSGTVTGAVTGTLSGASGSIGLLRNTSTGQRTEIDQNGVRVYDTNGTLRVRLGIW